MKTTVLTILLFMSGLQSYAQSAAEAIREGNGYYRSGAYNKAAGAYEKALQAEPGNEAARLNQAAALYRQDQKVEAVQQFSALAREAGDPSLKAKAWYNKGVILSQQKNLAESIEAYKEALRLDPADRQARENLQKALLELKKKAPPPKKENKQDKKKQDPKQNQSPRPQSRLSPKETEQRLKLLEQKEKEVQQRIRREQSGKAGSTGKDW